MEHPRNRLVPRFLVQQFAVLEDLASVDVVEVLEVAVKIENGLET